MIDSPPFAIAESAAVSDAAAAIARLLLGSTPPGPDGAAAQRAGAALAREIEAAWQAARRPGGPQPSRQPGTQAWELVPAALEFATALMDVPARARRHHASGDGSAGRPEPSRETISRALRLGYRDVLLRRRTGRAFARMVHAAAALQRDAAAVQPPGWPAWQDSITALARTCTRLGPLTRHGCSPATPVWTRGATQLRHYPARGAAQHRAPLVVVYAMINRPGVLDITPERSLLGALAADRDVYLLDWGDPGPEDGALDLGQLLEQRLGAAVDAVRARHGGQRIHLAGVCQGGTLATLYASQAGGIASLAALVAPFGRSGRSDALGNLVRDLDPAMLADADGLVPGVWLVALFQMLTALRRHGPAPVAPGAHPADGFSQRLQAWMFDCPHQPARAFGEYLRLVYRDNALLRSPRGASHWRHALTRMQVPVLNVNARHDHLVPPSASRVLGELVPGARYHERTFSAGHVGVLVGRQARHRLQPTLREWLRQHDAASTRRST